MCGIIGYIGHKKASEVITEGLKKLEYRGYDSVGIAIIDNKKLIVKKDKGMVEQVSNSMEFTNLNGNIGIGHTRWATHGAVCKENSHPHTDCSKRVVLAHNGVIENFSSLKKQIKNHKFNSETDSEIIAHLIENNLKKMSFWDSFSKAVDQLEGSYAIVAMDALDQKRIYIARKNSPIVIGLGNGEMICASDIPAMLDHTKTFVQIEDDEKAIIERDGYKIFDKFGSEKKGKIMKVDWNVETAQKSGHPYFMIKEIMDQRHFINESLSSDISELKKQIDKFDNIHIIAAGTSYHAALFLANKLLNKGKFAQAFIASDYPFNVKIDKNILLIAISQSGETADVITAIKHTKKSTKIGITNVVGSSLTRIVDHSIYLNAGPEIGVAATKTFTAQLAIISKIFADKEKIHFIPQAINNALKKHEKIKEISKILKNTQNVFFIARGVTTPIAYEASLKFKEITYIHSEAYPAGELKHGTLSLIEKDTPVVVLAPNDATAQKLLANLKEAKARGAKIISITNNPDIEAESDYLVKLESNDEIGYPFEIIALMQLLAYEVSVLRKINPDRPRNLAKAVTVE